MQNFIHSHSSAAKETCGLHGLLEQALKSPLSQWVLRGLEVFKVIVPPAKVFLFVFGELFDDDVNVLAQGVVVMYALGYLSHPLGWRREGGKGERKEGEGVARERGGEEKRGRVWSGKEEGRRRV